MNIKINGFSRDFSGREAPCLGVFGGEGSGKTRFCATAGEWAEDRGTVPGWVVCDRKTRNTVREIYNELGLELPLINQRDLIERSEALKIATMDREKDDSKIAAIYTGVYVRLVDLLGSLAANPTVNPIIVETGTQIWDWIAFSHFGRKQGVGKSRVWGPPKQDWTDLIDALSGKLLVLTFWEKDAYKGDDKAGFTKPDGPPHLGYTATSMVRLTCDKTRRLKPDETYTDRYSLDVYASQDNVALEGVNGLLRGEAIRFNSLLSILCPEY